MQRVLMAILALALSAGGASAQMMQAIVGNVQPAVATYTAGPCDITTFTAWYGLRACSAAIAAAGTQSIVDLVKLSDSSTCTAKVATNGFVDLTVGTPCTSNTQTVTAWAGGSTGSLTGSISTTTLTVTACASGTPVVGDIIYTLNGGTALTPENHIISGPVGTACNGTFTLSNSSPAASQTIQFTPGVVASKLYDQTGGGRDLTATAGNRLELVFSGSFPCSTFPCLMSTSGSGTLRSASNFTPATGLASMSTVANRMTGIGQVEFIEVNGANGDNIQSDLNVANNWFNTGNNGSGFAAAANDNTWHAANAVINGASPNSIINIDGSVTTGSATKSTQAGKITFCNGDVGPSIGLCVEGGFTDNVDWGTTIRASLNSNQHSATTGWNF